MSENVSCGGCQLQGKNMAGEMYLDEGCDEDLDSCVLENERRVHEPHNSG